MKACLSVGVSVRAHMCAHMRAHTLLCKRFVHACAHSRTCSACVPASVCPPVLVRDLALSRASVMPITTNARHPPTFQTAAYPSTLRLAYLAQLGMCNVACPAYSLSRCQWTKQTASGCEKPTVHLNIFMSTFQLPSSMIRV